MVKEEDLEQKVISDLEENGYNVINMGGGTFDLFVELKPGIGEFIELKIANKNYKNQPKPPREKGLSLASFISSSKNLI